MKNLVAVLIVTAVLAACAQYTYTNTRASMHPRQDLMPSMPATHWDDYVSNGGAFRGK